jgi:MFS family permease
MTSELGFTPADLNNSYATGSATLAIGALIFIPFALKYGRRPIYLLSLTGQIVVAIWAAKMTTVADLYLIQAFNCLLGALAEVIVQMTIADVFFLHERGLMNTLFISTMSIGTTMAALVAGYVSVSQGWRWVWWWVAILLSICLVFFIFFYEETKFVYKIDGVSNSEATTTSQVEIHGGRRDKKSFDESLQPVSSAATHPANTRRKTYFQRVMPITASSGRLKGLAHHVYQPLLVVVTIPAVIYVALIYGLITAALQVSVTLIASYMPAPPYNFTPAQVGLMSLPIFIGNIVGTIASAPFADRIILYLSRKNKGIYEPEMRLRLLLVFAPLFSGGLAFFGFALGKGMSWPVVAVAAGIYSGAMTPILSLALSYLTDAYTDVSHSIAPNCRADLIQCFRSLETLSLVLLLYAMFWPPYSSFPSRLGLLGCLYSMSR